MNYRNEIDRLYQIDFGQPRESAVELVILAGIAIAFYFYLDSIAGFVWIGTILASDALYVGILKTRPKACTQRDYDMAGIAIIVSMASFLWFSAYVTSSGEFSLIIMGLMLIGIAMLYVIRRADTAIWLVLAEVSLLYAMSMHALLTIFMPIVEGYEVLLVWVAGTVFLGNFAQVVLSNRKNRLDTAAAALRSIQAQKMEATGQLVGGVAHDFNNILTAIIGNLELYAEVENQNDKDQFVTQAKESAELAAKLIRQLLAYARQSKLDIQTTNLSVIFDQLQNLSRRLLPRSVSLEFAHPDPHIEIEVDASQLTTALINLLVNARDALPEQGRVVIDCQKRVVGPSFGKLVGYSLKQGTFVEISVSDNGSGIDPAIIDEVTVPFFTTKPVGKGSGLGLSMVEGFARQSGGGLKITSSQKGTCVSIYLPINRSDDRAHKAP